MTTPPSASIRVALVDDQQMVRAGFRMLVESQPDLTVVAEAGDGQEALDVLARCDADVVLMDVRMPRLDGVEATRRLVADAGRGVDGGAGGEPVGPRVVVLTTFDLDEYAFAALRAGASAFLLKDAAPDDVLDAIRSVHAGDAVVAPSTTRRLLDHFVQGATARVADPAVDPVVEARVSTLTDREREVLDLVARGLTNPEIAARLVVSEATVKTHMSRLLTKTDSRDRVQLVLLALEVGLG